MAITSVPVRARIKIGNVSVVTPYILSFNVRKSRGQSTTFDASLKVSHDEISGAVTGGNVTIEAGTVDNMPLIFTGIIKTAKMSPCFDDPNYVVLTISGHDCLGLLQGKKYTRRCRATRGMFACIQDVTRRGLKSGKFTYDTTNNVFEINPGIVDKETAGAQTNSISDYGSIKTGQARSETNLRPVQITVSDVL